MSAQEAYTIGAEVRSTDGLAGTLTRVVIDPIRRTVTHLVVTPEASGAPGRLVPSEWASEADGVVHLSHGQADVEACQAAEETLFLSGAPDPMGYDPGHTLSWPYYPLAAGWGLAMSAGPLPGPDAQDRLVEVGRIPPGEVDVKRGQPVHATDGEIGRVDGLIVDGQTELVTHVLLQEGHLWGRKQVAIPIAAVSSFRDGIEVHLSRQDIERLPAVDLDTMG